MCKSSISSSRLGLSDGDASIPADILASCRDRVCACVCAVRRPTERAPDTMAARVLACASCHGARGRGHQRRLFSAAGGQARGLSLQPAGGVQGRAPQISADELSAGISARRVSEADGRTFRLAAAAISGACGSRPSATTSSARGESIATNGDPQRGVPACAGCHGPTLGGMEPAIPGLLGLRASYISAQLGGWRYGTRTAAAPDCMQIVAGLLTEDDVKARRGLSVVACRRRRTRRLRQARQPADAARLRQRAELKGDRAYAENLTALALAGSARIVAAGRRSRSRWRRMRLCSPRANISPAPATASPVTPRARARPLPAACR